MDKNISFASHKVTNGDEIHTAIVSMNPDQELNMVCEYLVLEGTGRFEGITGSISMWGSRDFINQTWTMEGVGEVIY